MRLLVLGGTKFVGRHIAGAALEAGANVTLFHRGKTHAPELDRCEHVYGDRARDLHRLGERAWDAVIDTSAYTPDIVERSARYFCGRTARYVFVSTISVYDADAAREKVDEDSSLARLAPNHPRTELRADFANYGSLKALCEAVVQSVFRHRASIVRPALVAGPFDPTDRFTYWPLRIAAGGEVLAPGDARHDLQYVDARDLANFVVKLAQRGPGGIFNAVTGPGQFHFGELLEGAKRIAASNARFVYADEQFLIDNGVQMWSDLPLWIASNDPHYAIVHATNARAVVAGLRVRPIAETVRDTLHWARAARKSLDALHAGLSLSREAEILRQYSLRQAPQDAEVK